MKQQLEQAIETARQALTTGQQQVNAAKTAVTEATESHGRSVSALNSNTDDSDSIILELTSAVGKCVARKNQAAARLSQAESEANLPVLQAAVQSAERALADYIAEQAVSKLARTIEARGNQLREAMGTVLSILTEVKTAAAESCTAQGLPDTRVDAMLALHVGHALEGLDLPSLRLVANAPPLVRLAFAVHGEFPQWLEHATDPSEPVRLALQGTPVLQVLAARHSEQVTAQRDTARAKLEAECATLARAVADEIEQIATPTVGRLNGGASAADCQAACLSAKAGRLALRRPLPFDSFETQWSAQVAGVRPPKYNEFTSNSKVAQQYDRTREALDSYSMTGWERSDAIARASSQMGQPRFENHGILQP